MADKNLELALRIRADLKQAKSALEQFETTLDSNTKSAAALGKSQKSIGQVNTAQSVKNLKSLDQAQSQATRSAQELNQSQTTLGGGFTKLASSVKAATLAVAAGYGVRQISQTADAWTAYQNRLRLVTDTQGQLATASQDVYEIARLTSQRLDSTAAVYQRFAQNAERLNLSQERTAALTQTVSKAIAISGGSAESAEAALVQFGQALASGVLRGEEFNSVMEQAPGLAQALAEGLGVNVGQLRAMANEGQLTADVLVNALGNAANSVDTKFETRVRTIAQAATELDTAFTRIVGTLSSSTGISESAADAIAGLADVLDALSDNADILSAALDASLALAAGKAVAALTNLTTEGLKNIAMNKAATVAAAEKALADEGAAVAAQRAAVAELESSRATVAKAEADVAATAAEARRTASVAAASTAISGKAALDARATAAATAATAAEARLTAALEARAVASTAVATTTQAVTRATAASTAAVSAAATATSFMTRAMSTVFAVGGRLLSFLGGPLGLILSLGLAATAFIDFGNDAESGMDKAANATESANIRIRNAARGIVRDLNLGDTKNASFDQLTGGIDQLEQQLEAAKAVRDEIQSYEDQDIPTVLTDLPTLDEANEKIRALTAAIQQLKAEQSGSRFNSDRDGDKYLDSLNKQYAQLQKLTPTEEALQYLREKQIDQNSELGQQILQQAKDNEALAAANKTKLETERQANAEAEAAHRKTEQRAKAQQSYVDQLERTAATIGLSKDAAQEYNLAELGLTGTLLERARAAQAAITAQERLNQATEDGKTLEGIRGRVSELEGNPAVARSRALQAQYGDLIKRLGESGDQAGVDLVNKLINLDLARTRLQELQGTIDSTLSEQSRLESSINTQQDAGLLTELSAREKIVDLHRQTAAELERQRPLLEEMARQPGVVGETAQAALQALDDEITRLQGTMTLLQSTLKEGLQTGISDAIRGLADGTYTLQEAVNSLVQSVADSMLRMAADGLAEMATNNIIGLFSQSAQAAGQAATQSAAQQVAAISTVTTAQTTADSVRATSAITAANTAVTGTAPAATAATAQWTPSATAASVGSFGSAAAIGLAALLAVLAMAKGNFFATGGHVRGPGTATSDSIPAMLSDNEFVTRAAVVRQPGALSFLKDFNARGMSSLDQWAGRVRHATGGLAGTPAPSAPSPMMGASDLNENSTTAQVDNNFRFVSLFDVDDIGKRLGESSNFEDTVFNVVSSNPGKYKDLLSS